MSLVPTREDVARGQGYAAATAVWAEKYAALSAKLAEAERERAANHNLAVANGQRAKEEFYRAETAEARVAELTRDLDSREDDMRAAAVINAGLRTRVAELEKALKEGRRAIGDHNAPTDCYATGPLTGDAYRDIVECHACSFIAMYDAALSATKEPKP